MLRCPGLGSLGALALVATCANQEQSRPQQVPVPNSATATTEPTPSGGVAVAAVPSGGGEDARPHPNQKKSPPRDEPRVYAKSRFVWIRESPATDVTWIGYLWSGGSVKLRSTKLYYGPGCLRWYAVEPRGFVCVDDKRATLDADDPVFAKIARHAPHLDSPWPHRYGESRDVQLYEQLPSREEQRSREWDLEAHLERLASARRGDVDDQLRGVDLTPATDDPFQLTGLSPASHEQRRRLKPRSTVAYSREVLHDGRSFLLTADLMWAPKDRVAPYPKVTFHGVELGKDAKLPLAFFRGEDQPRYDLRDGKPVAKGQRYERHSWVELTGSKREYEGSTYLEAKSGSWLKADDAVVPEVREQTPWGATVGQADTTGQAPRGRATWIEASVWGGWLLAYEGTKPVYATLISPGRGGTPVPGKDPLETASTPVGTFKITGKFATATMVAPHEFTHSDVPWTQNFSGPHALHGAYWHNDWGNRKSAGCVNVSPIDGKWLYEFTEPTVPAGWHGLRWQTQLDPATTYIVRR